ncbi:uncharacterized protein LOC130726272 [Lotus japonicus]|uniref:uncharacterized protein LOC130726272 n=1 Tax=Lotus japonicus TaxID=34305 RepID=UPI00258B4DD7|nr:uncharacterized protein LOC130726272 [Lotus japonicus]
MEAEAILKLFDSCWFGIQNLKEQPSFLTSPSSHVNSDHLVKEGPSLEPVLSRIQTGHTRSMSDQLNSMTSFKHDSPSPDPAFFSPKLQTIFSGKDVTDPEGPSLEPVLSRIQTGHTRSMSDQLNSMTSFKHDSPSPDPAFFSPKLQTIFSGKDVTDTEAGKQAHMQLEVLPKKNITRRGRRKRERKSLSDLEFEELKGFMDLGFVFSEKDKDSSLASIIPGLQRFGNNAEEEKDSNESAIQRPYLSEAWEDQERRKKDKPLMNWKINAVNNEIDMKDSLRWWARTVVSTVR